MYSFSITLSRLALLVLTFAWSPATHATPGQPGTLDSTWATASPLGAGRAIITLPSGDEKAYAIAQQTDGKLLVAGECFVTAAGGGLRLCGVRFNANGTLDTSFGSAGLVSTAFGSNNLDRGRSILIQPDHKIVIAGLCDTGPANLRGRIYDFCGARYLPNGAIDTTFGTGGKVITKVGVRIYTDSEVTVAVARQPDGKLVLASSCHYDGFDENNIAFSDIRLCTLRYHPNGTLDLSFGMGGSVLTKLGANPSAALLGGLVVQQDGKVVVASFCYFGGGNIGTTRFCAARYQTNGTLDVSFGGTGSGKIYVPTTFGISEVNAMTVQADGKLLMAGSCVVSGTFSAQQGMCAVRLNADGTVDVDFVGPVVGGDRPGTVVTPVDSVANTTFAESATAIAVQPDGKLVLAGHCTIDTVTGGSNNHNVRFCAARHHSNGALDRSFGTAGKTLTLMASASSDSALAAVLQPDGKLVVAGYCYPGNGGSDICALRYDGGPFGNQNCKPDVDGDGEFLATTDALIYSRLARGVTGTALIGGITFPAAATRKTWPQIRDYLITQCGMTLAP